MHGDDADASETAAAVEAFECIGDETRARILATLGSIRGAAEAPPELSFSELRAAVDSDVSSSRFNYHLQELVGRYVQHTGDGYRMRPAGMLLYRTMRAGTITEALDTDPLDVGVDCYRCGGSLLADPGVGEFWIGCPDCDHFYDMVMAPSRTAAEGSVADRLARLDQYNRHRRLAFSRGICPICMNGTDQRIATVDETPYDRCALVDHHVHWSCDHCGNRMFATPGMAVFDAPEVLSFFDARGLDLRDHTVWEFAFAMTDRALTVRSTDPWELSLALEHAGDRRELVLDDDLTVVSSTDG